MPSFLAKITSKNDISKRRMKFILAFIGAATIAILTLVAYIPAIQGGYIWDDDVYVTENPLLTAPDGLRRIWFSLDSPSQYFPLVYTTFRIEHAIWGLNPMGYHIVNVCLHIINALLLWLILSRLGIRGSWLAAAIWALHPVNVESVAWITERKNTLSTLFYLLTVLAWLRFVEASGRGRYWYYGLSIILCQLALFAKTTACTLPAAMLLVVWLRGEKLKAGSSFIKRLIQVLPFVFQGVVMGLISIWWEQNRQGTQGAEFEFTILQRVLIASKALWFYLGKLIWPRKLAFSYPKWNVDPAEPLQYVWLVLVILLCGLMWWRRKVVGSGIIVALSFFVAALTPMLGFFSLYTFRYTFVADHYQYLACIGPIALVSWLLADRRLKVSPIKLMASIVILAVLGMLTWRQGHAYKDAETLWRFTIAANPKCALAHNNLANILDRQRKKDEAIQHYYEALRHNPDLPEAHLNLGIALVEIGCLDEAISHYQEVIRLAPNFADAYYNLGVALSKQGKKDEAIEEYLKAIHLKPDFAEAHSNLGVELVARRKLDDAIFHFCRALEIKPEYAEAHNNLAAALYFKGDYNRAMQEIQLCLKFGGRPHPGLVEAISKKLDEKQ